MKASRGVSIAPTSLFFISHRLNRKTMGQQQLLLLVLSTVIVGLATIGGIEAFNAGELSADQRQLQQAALELATEVQTKAKTPTVLEGGGGSVDSSWKVYDLGYDDRNPTLLTSPPGIIYRPRSDVECVLKDSVVDAASGNSVSFSTSPKLVVSCATEDNHVAVGINGPDPENLEAKSVVR